MKQSSLRLSASLAILSSIFVFTHAGADEPVVYSGLLSEVPWPTQLDETKPADSEVVRRRAIAFNTTQLSDLGVGDILPFALFDDVQYEGVIQSMEKRSATQYTIVGRIKDHPTGSFVLVVENEALVADVNIPAGPTYTIRYVGDGMAIVSQIDTNLLLPCGLNGQKDKALDQSRDAAIARAGAEPPVTMRDNGAYVDVLVGYTPKAKLDAGGTSGIIALINLGITLGNNSYTNSNVAQRLNLVHTVEVNYVESDSTSVDLSRLTSPSDGYMDELHQLRNEYRADLVDVVLGVATTACGVAYLLTSPAPGFPTLGFSVVVDSCISGQTFQHELGHNMGLAHGRGDGGGASGGIFSYSFGWRYFGTDSNQYRTVMAYAPGTRIQYFSNPNVSFAGAPTGVPIGDPNEAFNAQTLDLTAATVANYRLSNDDFVNRIVMPGGGNSMSGGVNTGKTFEGGEPTHAGVAGGKSAWWSWTPTSAGTATVSTAGSSYDTLLGVYTGTSVNALTSIASNDDSGGTTSSASFAATAGVEYKIAVDGKAGASGTTSLLVTTTALPQVSSTPTSLNIVTAELTSPAAQTFQIKNVGGGTMNYTVTDNVSWLSASPGSGSSVAESDSITLTFSTAALAPANYLAEITVTSAGATNSPFTIPVNLTVLARPVNDDFANAITLPGATGTTNTTNIGATSQSGEPLHAGQPGSTSLWWKWTAPASGTATFDTLGSNFDTTLGIYTGSAVNSLAEIASDDDSGGSGGPSIASFSCVAGTTYRIAVDGWTGATGNITLNYAAPSTVAGWESF
jgi:hypothetical protein